MASDDSSDRQRSARPLIEVSPETADRLRDPRIVLAIVAGFCGAIALFAGYLGVSGTLDPAKQLPYLVSGGVGGLFLLGVAAALLFSSDLSVARREIRDLRDVIDRMASQVDELHDRLAQAPSPPATAVNGTEPATPTARRRRRAGEPA